MTEMPQQPEKPSRGEARRQAILEAAMDLFLEQGFERTSLSDILRRSKGSRSTLYDAFGNKEGLLLAMVQEACHRVWSTVDPGDDRSDGPGLQATAEGLTAFGLHFLKTVTGQRSISVYRIMVAEGHRFPEIARQFYGEGPKLLTDRLTAVFLRGQADGLLIEGDARRLAQIFIGTLVSDFHIRRTLGLVPVIADEDMETHVQAAVTVFLNGAGRPSGG